MAGQQAKILSDQQIESLLVYASATRNPDRHCSAVHQGGLRTAEIANLTWDMVIGPAGEVGTLLELHDYAAKKRSGRRIPIHPDLRAALIAWRSKGVEAQDPRGAKGQGKSGACVRLQCAPKGIQPGFPG